MPVSDAQKRASNKYIKDNMATLSCKVKKDEASTFKDYAAKQGKTSNTVLKDYVMQCIAHDAAPPPPILGSAENPVSPLNQPQEIKNAVREVVGYLNSVIKPSTGFSYSVDAKFTTELIAKRLMDGATVESLKRVIDESFAYCLRNNTPKVKRMSPRALFGV